MGREVRKVPKDWAHPKKQNGSYQPMFDRDYESEFNEWLEEKKKWESGLMKDYSAEGTGWKKKEDKYVNMPFEEWSGSAPDSRYYMPKWKEEEKTHLMMYEDTTEGTPISPAFEKPEELARWLADNNASAFGGTTATYEQWLNMIVNCGYSVSMVLSNKGLQNGVEFAADLTK